MTCKQEFPRLVEMQEKYAKQGLVAISVSLDDPNDKDAKDRVFKFLEKKKATFTNLILDEKPEVWQAKLKIDGPPCIFVFDREGKIASKVTLEGYDEVEKVVAGLLKK
jgi:hypothetical protein